MKYMNQKGQSIVETALVLPVIVLILSAIIDFGLMFNNYIIISNAAREAARAAAIGAGDSEILEAVNTMTDTLDSMSLTISINPSSFSRHSGEPLSVTIEYDYTYITPLVGSLLPAPTRLRAKTVMRME